MAATVVSAHRQVSKRAQWCCVLKSQHLAIDDRRRDVVVRLELPILIPMDATPVFAAVPGTMLARPSFVLAMPNLVKLF
jgi:hypothetical protein